MGHHLAQHVGKCVALTFDEKYYCRASDCRFEPGWTYLEQIAAADDLGLWIARPRWGWNHDDDPPEGYPTHLLLPWSAIASAALFHGEAPVDWQDKGVGF